MNVPLVNQVEAYGPLREQLLERVAAVVDSGTWILGPELEAFEHEAASYLGVDYAIGVANCTDAMVLILDALGIGTGDEVICPAYTFYASAEAIARCGARPVFCDIDRDTLNLDVDDAVSRITDRTRAFLAVHLAGRPAPISGLPAGIPIVGDAAQAFGASHDGVRTGALGIATAFSFFPSKNLFCFGDGGLVSTHDADLAARVRTLRNHGTPNLGSASSVRSFEAIGYNSRLDELHASTLRLCLPHIDDWNGKRREAALRYEELGLGKWLELPRDEPGHVYHLYAARTDRRDAVMDALRREGIGCMSLYDPPLHLLSPFAEFRDAGDSLPETERAAREVVVLPLWPGMTAEQQERVVEVVKSALAAPASV
jgi:dTDP-4-amino-4,6-dideoxygalactose transaminase